MSSRNKSFALNGSGKKIMQNSRKEYNESRARMRPVNKANYNMKFGSVPEKQFFSKNINIGQPSAKIVNNSVAKGPNKSDHVLLPISNGMKQNITPSSKNCLNLLDKQKSLSRPGVDGKTKLMEPQALKRKEEVNHSSVPCLKAMSGLVPKTTNRLNLSSSFKKGASSDKEDYTTSAKYNTMNLEFSKGVHMDPKDNCSNERQDEIAIDKENLIEFGEDRDTTKVKHTIDHVLLDIHGNSRDLSSYSSGRDPSKFSRDKALLLDGNHSMKLTLESNMGQCANCNGNSNFTSKKRKESLFNENPKADDDNDSDVGVQVNNISCNQPKKLKPSRVTKDELKQIEDGGCDLNHMGVEDDTGSISNNGIAKVSISSCVERQCYSCSKPIDKPIWSGIFKTNDKEYVSLDGHLSTKSGEKAWSLSRQLHQMVEVKKLSRMEVWPKAWELSTPIGDTIGIYFFPHEMRQDEGLDQLVREVMENDLALQAIIGEVEMLIFPSILLPNHHQTFQRKHYLWGVFKRREHKGDVVEEHVNAMGCCEKEKQQNHVSDQPNHGLPTEEPNQEMIQIASAMSLERDNQEVEASRLKGPTNKGFDLKAPSEEGRETDGTPIATGVAAFPTSHAKMNPSMGHNPSRLMGFVVRQTPKLDRIIREIEREGALVFAMQGEMVGAGSWVASKGTDTQSK